MCENKKNASKTEFAQAPFGQTSKLDVSSPNHQNQVYIIDYVDV